MQRVRCSLGGETRLLLTPRGVPLDELAALARAKFGVGDEARLLCPDPAGGEPITLMSDDDLSYMRYEYGGEVPLLLSPPPARVPTPTPEPAPAPPPPPPLPPPTPPSSFGDGASLEMLVPSLAGLLRAAIDQAVSSMPTPPPPPAPAPGPAPAPLLPPPLAPPPLAPPPPAPPRPAPPPPPPMEPVPPPQGRMTPSPEPRLPPPPPPNIPKEPKPKDKSGPLYAKFATPDAPVRKARNPKLIQKGVEMAFRKRQNVKFKESKADVLGCFRRAVSSAWCTVSRKQR